VRLSDDMLSEEERLSTFSREGYLVVPNVLSAEEVADATHGFHEYLRDMGVDVDDLEGTGQNLAKLSSTGGAGGILDIFWADFKLKVAENPNVVRIMSELWQATYGSCGEGVEEGDLWSHVHGTFDATRPLAAIDRVCFRLPDNISATLGGSKGKIKQRGLQRHLAPHLDCCPPHRPGEDDGALPPGSKWRPIQGFVALTDNLEPNQGGFECCPGHHRVFKSWAASRPWQPQPASKQVGRRGAKAELVPPPCQGAFTPMRPTEDADVLARFCHVPCRAGDLVLWDNRLPHSNSRAHRGRVPREVVYIGLIPRVPVNLEYVREQRDRFRSGRLPADFWQSQGADVRQHCGYHFSDLGREMMLLDEI
jgi:ectoine hydroxylase-related dioxygenase (phytanoyl-CoA dioxygenase family)